MREASMRSRRLVPAITAVILLLGLAPSSAFARKHPSPNGRCAININIAPPRIVAGDPVVIFGRLRCVHPANAANREVKLFHHLAGLPGFTFVQSTTTDANGFYEFSRADGVVETNRAWYVRSRGAQSAPKRIRVAAQVTLSGPTEGQLLTGFANRVTFTGAVSPADVGARVILQRQNATTGGEWHRIDAGFVGVGGSFTIVHTFVVPGDANIRALVRSQGRNVPSESNVLAYVISQAQNPALTIQASADPISFGEAVTISGKLASGPNQPVTLLARTARQHAFVPVAEVSANAMGEYSFPAQSPVNSIFYRVQAVGGPPCLLPPGVVCPELANRRRVSSAVRYQRVLSAVLYEGVKDVLTAQVSATTVQAGQAVTFSGTVSPDHTGHAIYLERKNANGSGFHVIQAAFVGAGSRYSIAHRLYDPGTKVLRVFIPGGPENQGAASQPFSILVTPAAASTLVPEAPQNSTLPPEGQS
jgi:hypothetical protein